jgi:hypothetical protein
MKGDLLMPSWNEPHLLKLTKESHQHFLGLDPFVKTEPP